MGKGVGGDIALHQTLNGCVANEHKSMHVVWPDQGV